MKLTLFEPVDGPVTITTAAALVDALREREGVYVSHPDAGYHDSPYSDELAFYVLIPTRLVE